MTVIFSHSKGSKLPCQRIGRSVYFEKHISAMLTVFKFQGLRPNMADVALDGFGF
jgi:hypothetical protein